MTHTDLADRITAFKRSLADRKDGLRRAFVSIEDHVKAEVDAILSDQAAGRAVVPEIGYADIRDGNVGDAAKAAIRRRGAVIVRGVVSEAQATDWNAEIVGYAKRNGFYAQAEAARGAGRPQMLSLYWSRPQIAARQAPALAGTRAFLNRLWRFDGAGVDPDDECGYADRVRRREPGDRTLTLRPHIDGGAAERWLEPGFQRLYAPVLTGDWRAFDPFDGRRREGASETPAPFVCSMFRTWQGWTALTPQGPGDGTLQLVPIARGLAYMLLRALQADAPDDRLPGADPAGGLWPDEDRHAALLAGLVSIPAVGPGDAVWWHCDLAHGVEAVHHGAGESNVFYIAAAPGCARNRAFLAKQKAAFLDGRSAPDFRPEDYETAYTDRATPADLTDLGRRQMGF